jgi:aryl-alcohol dehydrogenase-like predicted oxidoreductase/spore coat polysaccharide biosynthesis protein SpsF (cytidylyltransferase family)
LPAKVFLPIAGTPIAVLVARRAANTGRKVIVATSNDSSDDSFASLIESENIECFRGSLTNTLSRFVNALADYDDDTVVIRLTADNIVPDGALIDEMEEYFFSNELKYLGSVGKESGLPYGVSVELMWLRHLREALENTTSDSDREHVTPYIVRKFGRKVFDRYNSLGMSHFRCTVDHLEDYLAILKVFDKVSDPVHAPFVDLVHKVEQVEQNPAVAVKSLPLILGGAQLGSKYGITNEQAAPSYTEVDVLINAALNSGITTFDTARAYGDSESAIGKALCNVSEDKVQIVTKLGSLSDCPSDGSASTVASFVEASIFRSCRELRRNVLDCVLLHRVSHRDEWNGEAWRTLKNLKDHGVINQLGASVQSPVELQRVLHDALVTVIQMPFNIVDGRWHDVLVDLIEAKRDREISVHARSVYLQGLLLTDDATLWRRANCTIFEDVVSWLGEQANEFDRESIADLCLSYVQSQSWVDGVVVGMTSITQLRENVRLATLKLMTPEELASLDRHRPELPEVVLNPAFWRET